MGAGAHIGHNNGLLESLTVPVCNVAIGLARREVWTSLQSAAPQHKTWVATGQTVRLWELLVTDRIPDEAGPLRYRNKFGPIRR